MATGHWTESMRSFDVATSTSLPTMAGIDGVARVGQPVEVDLEAVYFDTVDLALGRRDVTVRRRTGGADEGWRLELASAVDGRVELQRPLGRAVRTVPRALLEPVRALVRDHRLVPVARIETRRRQRTLMDADGAVLAHVSDDHVRTEQQLRGRGSVLQWREWRVELVAGDDSLLDLVEELFRHAGAGPAHAPTELFRTLLDVLPPPPPRAGKKKRRRATAGDAAVHQLQRHVSRLIEQDLRLRGDEATAVHKMRVVVRRLRSILKTYSPLLEDVATQGSLDRELRWLGQALAPARDAQVLRERLRDLVAAEPDELVLGPVAAHLDDALRHAELDTRKSALDALGDVRYFRLLDDLERFTRSPSFTGTADEPATEVFPRLLQRQARRLRRAVEEARRTDDGEQRTIALHGARRKAKRLRYAAESMHPVLGKQTSQLAASLEHVQRALGEVQDTVMSRQVLRDHGARAHVAGKNGFTYGRLHMLEQTKAEAALRDFEDAWARLPLKGLRRRLSK